MPDAGRTLSFMLVLLFILYSYGSGNGGPQRTFAGDAIQLSLAGTGSSPAAGVGAPIAETSGGQLAFSRLFGTETIPGREGTDVVVDSFGNVYVTGRAQERVWDPGGFYRSIYSALLLKFDPGGQLLWERAYNGPNHTVGAHGNDGIPHVAVDSLGNVYLSGYIVNLTEYGGEGFYTDGFLFKFDSAGNLLWQRMWDNELESFGGPDVFVDPVGAVYLTGNLNTTASCSSQPCTVGYVAKFDQSGNLEWHRGLARFLVDGVTALGGTVDNAGNFYSIGFFRDEHPEYGFLIRPNYFVKLDSTGNLVWQTAWRDVNPYRERWGLGVAVDDVGNPYLVGSTYGCPPPQDPLTEYQIACEDALVLTFDSGGTLLWMRTWGSAERPGFARSVAVDRSGNIHVAGAMGWIPEGETCPLRCEESAFFLKLDAAGNLISHHTWHGTGSTGRGLLSDLRSDANTIAADPDGNPFVTGTVFGEFPFVVDDPPINDTLGTPVGGIIVAPSNLSFVDSANLSFIDAYGAIRPVGLIAGDYPITEFPNAYLFHSVPSTPLVLEATAATAAVSLAWAEPIPDAGPRVSRYNIYRAPSRIPLASTELLTYVDTSVVVGHGQLTFSYFVTAVRGFGESQLSNEVQVTPSAPFYWCVGEECEIRGDALFSQVTLSDGGFRFTASGLSGTTGHVNVSLPAGLVSNRSQIRVLIDSVQLPEGEVVITSRGASARSNAVIFVSFTFRFHSSVSIDVVFIESPTPRGGLTVPAYLIIIAASASVVVALVFLARLRRTRGRR